MKTDKVHADTSTTEFNTKEIQCSLDNIVPLIRSNEWLEGYKNQVVSQFGLNVEEETKFEPVNEKFSDKLVKVYAFNVDSLHFINFNKILEMNLNKTELNELAAKNSERLIPFSVLELPELIYVIQANDIMLTTGLLLHDTLWDVDATREVQGDPIIAIPGRDSILVTNQYNKSATRLLKSMALAEYATNEFPLTDSLFLRENGKWIVSK